MHAPQIILFVLMGLEIGVVMSKHGQPRPPFHLGYTLAGLVVVLALLAWGGFFGKV